MRKNLIRVCSLALCACALSSCATILSSPRPKVTIDGNISEPVTIQTSAEIYHNVRLPYVVRINRKALDGQRIYVHSERARYKDIVLSKTVNEVAFGNILLGGVLGLLVDLGTNSVSRPAQKYFYVDKREAQLYEQESDKKD